MTATDRTRLIEEIRSAQDWDSDLFHRLWRVPDINQDLVSLAIISLNMAYTLAHVALHADQPTVRVQGSATNPFPAGPPGNDEDEDEEEDDGKLSLGAVVTGAVLREDKLVDWIKRFRPMRVPARAAKSEAIKHVRAAFMWLSHATELEEAYDKPMKRKPR